MKNNKTSNKSNTNNSSNTRITVSTGVRYYTGSKTYHVEKTRNGVTFYGSTNTLKKAETMYKNA